MCRLAGGSASAALWRALFALWSVTEWRRGEEASSQMFFSVRRDDNRLADVARRPRESPGATRTETRSHGCVRWRHAGDGTPFGGGFFRFPPHKNCGAFFKSRRLLYSRCKTATFLPWLCALKIVTAFFFLNSCHWICKTFQICWLAGRNKHLVFTCARLNLIRASLALADAERCRKKNEKN